MKSAVTISLVPEARGGPFVFWENLPAACASAGEMGFDGVEVFPPSAEVIDGKALRSTLLGHGLQLAAVGTGAGWVKHQLTFTSPDKEVRRRAVDFARGIVDAAGRQGAPAIIGSMQGRWTEAADRSETLSLLRDALDRLGEVAAHHGVPLIYEPLNRYETNLVNTLGQGVDLLGTLFTRNVRLLADLFHMNIEETDLPGAIRAGGKAIGHVHLADSNRRPAGNGHTDFASIARALLNSGYTGYVSAEALPYPDGHGAAQATIKAFNEHFRS